MGTCTVQLSCTFKIISELIKSGLSDTLCTGTAFKYVLINFVVYKLEEEAF